MSFRLFLTAFFAVLMGVSAHAEPCDPIQASAPGVEATAAQTISIAEKYLEEHPNPSPVLARIASEYCDASQSSCNEKQDKTALTEGTGFVVACIDCTGQEGWRYFLFTASHVSQGKNAAIAIDGVRPRILGRLADNDQDIEILEIDRPGKSPLAYYRGFPRDSSTVPNSYTWGGSAGPRLFDEAEEKVPFSRFFHNKDTVEVNRSTDLLLNQYTYIPLAPWAQYKPTNVGTFDSGRTDYNVRKSPSRDDLIIRVDTSPGMSGSPMLRKISPPLLASLRYPSKTIVDGIVSRKSRFNDQSYVVSSEAMRDILKNYLDGQRGTTSETRWRYGGGFGFYRDFGNGTQEIDLSALKSVRLSQPSGNGVYSEGGNGVYSEGGNSIYSEGGKGSRSELPFHGGILWKNQSVLGFRVKRLNPAHPDEMHSIYGDAQSIALIRALGSQIEVEPISSDTPLSEILKKRDHRLEKKLTLITSDFPDPMSYVFEGTQLNRLEQDRATVTFDGKAFHLHLKKEDLDVSWRDQGLFSPILKASSHGKDYEIDIHEIFFMDFSLMRGLEMHDTQERHGAKLTKDLSNGFLQWDAPKVRVRDLQSGQVETIELAPCTGWHLFTDICKS